MLENCEANRNAFCALQMDQFALMQMGSPEMSQARNTMLLWHAKGNEFPLQNNIETRQPSPAWLVHHLK